jgi:hypothetical protein
MGHLLDALVREIRSADFVRALRWALASGEQMLSSVAGVWCNCLVPEVHLALGC